MTELDDITRVRAVHKDQKAFKLLYDQYAPFIWKVVFRLSSGNEQAAQEIMQQVFLRVWNKLPSFNGLSTLSTWIYRIAYNEAMSHFEREKRHLSVPLEEHHALQKASTFDARDLAQRLLAECSAEERFLITAREVEGLSFDELAEIAGSSSGALRVRLHRLKETLRERLETLSGKVCPA